MAELPCNDFRAFASSHPHPMSFSLWISIFEFARSLRKQCMQSGERAPGQEARVQGLGTQLRGQGSFWGGASELLWEGGHSELRPGRGKHVPVLDGAVGCSSKPSNDPVLGPT